jgi:molybdopterin molybdotransferase
MPANDAREDYVRAKLILQHGEFWAEVFAVQDSSMLGTLAAADALVVRKPLAAAIEGGEKVEVIPLSAL